MRRCHLIFALLIGVLAVPTIAAAATRPQATAQAATALTSSSAVLNGTVDPNGNATTYYFEYGPTKAYGTKTAVASAGAGTGKQPVSQPVGGLAASTTYHFRLVATSAAGTATSKDRTLTTLGAGQANPALSIAAGPNPLVWGGATTISGRLTGARTTAGLDVTLRQNPYPYTTGFKAVATVKTNPQGRYAFTRKPTRNVRYQVTAKAKPGGPVTSPSLQVRVRTKVTLRLSDSTPARGQSVRFSGSVYPAHDGRIIFLQRRTSMGRYATVARVKARHVLGGRRSSFARRVRLFRSGAYRAYVTGHFDHSAGFATRSVVVH